MSLSPSPLTPPGLAPSRGLLVERRTVLHLAGLSLALPWALARSAGAQASPSTGRDPERDAFLDFLGEWERLLREHLRTEGASEDAFLQRLAGAIARLDLASVPPIQHKAFENERITTGPVHGLDAKAFLVAIRMQPGASIRPHDHPSHLVATTCVEGTCHYEHYEPEREPPPHDDRETAFLVRRTRRGVLLPGRTTVLSKESDNIHAFTAGRKGALLLDFTMEVRPVGSFGMLAIDEEAEDAFHRTHRARWTEVTF